MLDLVIAPSFSVLSSKKCDEARYKIEKKIHTDNIINFVDISIVFKI